MIAPGGEAFTTDLRPADADADAGDGAYSGRDSDHRIHPDAVTSEELQCMW